MAAVWQGQADIKNRPVSRAVLLVGLDLGQFDDSAGFFESLLGAFGVFFLSFLEDGLWGTVNEGFGFAEAEACDVLNGLDDGYFLGAGVLQDDVVFRFF